MGSNFIRVKQNLHRLGGRIISKARRDKDTIFGARAIRKRIGITSRPTKDFDIFTKNPKQSAIEIERLSDKITRGDNFFVKKGKNPKTWKVKGFGKDRIRGTEDDFTLVDFTKTPRPKPKSTKINGVRFRTLEEEARAKLRLIKNKKFAFRREKDLEDLRRIIKSGRINRKG